MNRIKQLREEKGYTQQELADIIGGAKSTIACYENGTRKPSLDILKKLAECFDVSVDFLLGRVTNDLSQATDFHVGLSKSEEGTLTDEEKEEIKNFAKFVMSKRNGGK